MTQTTQEYYTARDAAEHSDTLACLYTNLRNNPKARANLVAALQALDAGETYANENCERRSHLRSMLIEQAIGYSGGNDTLTERGMVFVNGTYQRVAS